MATRKLPEHVAVTPAERTAAAALCRLFRRHHNLTQTEIARRVGCDHPAISRLEREDGRAPGRVVKAILDTFEPPPKPKPIACTCDAQVIDSRRIHTSICAVSIAACSDPKRIVEIEPRLPQPKN